MNFIPPYLEVFLNSIIKKRFYFFKEETYLLFNDDGIEVVNKAELTKDCTALLFIRKESIVTVSSLNKKYKLNFCGKEVIDAQLSVNSFFSYVNYELFLDNLASKESDFDFNGLVFYSDKMKALIEKIKPVIRTDKLICISGETGSGKEILAKNIHYNSTKKNLQFIAINCASLDSKSFDAEFFGAEKGSYTGTRTTQNGILNSANIGTLYFDDVSCISLKNQSKLLRLFDTFEYSMLGSDIVKKTSARIIVSSSVPLLELLWKNLIRKDLYYRLEKHSFDIPNLNDRKEDIVPLFKYFLNEDVGLSSTSLHYLNECDWVGNVRELKTLAKKLNLNFQNKIITAQDIKNNMLNSTTKKATYSNSENMFKFIELEMIKYHLKIQGGNVFKVSKTIKISRTTLIKRIKKYKIKYQKNYY